MKWVLMILSLISFVSCSKNEYIAIKDPIHLNICVLGNSYSNDAFSYVPFILKEYGITCKIHIYYRGSGSLHDLNHQWNDNSPYSIADLDGKEHIRLHFSIDTRKDNSWSKEDVLSANDVVSLEKWDIISLQQGGNRAKSIDTYYPHLPDIMSKIDSICDYTYGLAWFMAYNGALENENQASLDTQRQVVESGKFNLVFPVATSVFIAQEKEELQNLGESVYKKLYYSDNIHLQEGLPCYLAALTVSQSLLDHYRPGINVMGNNIRPSDKWIEKINGITPNGEAIGVTDENCELAQKIAVIANLFKYSILTDF